MVIFCENDQSSWSIFRSKIGRAIIWRLISTFFLKTRKIRIIEFIWIAFYVIWLYGYILWKPPVIMVSFSVKNWSCHNLKVNFYIFFKNLKNLRNRIYLNSFLCNMVIWLYSVKTTSHHGLIFGQKLVMP